VIVINFSTCLVVNKGFLSLGEEMDIKDLENFSIVHSLSATLALSAMSSCAKPELACAKHLDPWKLG